MKRKQASVVAKTCVAFTVAVSAASPVFAPFAHAETTSTPPSYVTAGSGLTLKEFADVPDGNWAQRHVAKLNLLNVVKGKSETEFDPDAFVTQQEAVVIAVRMAGWESDIDQYKSTSIVTGLNDVSYPEYVVLAREKGLIDLSEEQKNSAGWGTREASRDWVAKLLIRTIGKQTEADRLQTVPSTFGDASKFGGYAGYINEAAQLKLINGFEDNTFRPADKVTRAQIATMFSRAEPLMEKRSPMSVSGTVLDIGSGKMHLQDESGETREFNLAPNAIFFHKGNDPVKASIGDIQPYYKIYAVQKLGILYYVEIVEDQPQLEVIEGTLVGLDLTKMTVQLNVDNQVVDYSMVSAVSAEAADGSGLSFSELTVGSKLQLKRLAGVTNGKVLKIVATKLAFNKSSSGPIFNMDAANRRLTITAKDTGKQESYLVSPTAVITSDKDPLVKTIADLNEDDVINFEVVDNVITKVQVTAPRYLHAEGTLAQAIPDLSSYLIVEGQDKEPNAKKLSPNVTVTVEGLGVIGLSDLLAGDYVKLLINGSTDRVEKIIVTNRVITRLNQQTIVNYDTTNNFLTVKTSDGKPKTYIVSNKVSVKQDGTPVAFSNFVSVFQAGRKVTIVASNDDLVSIEINSKMTGTITNVNTVNSTITLRTAANDLLTFGYTALAQFHLYNKPTAVAADLTVGDTAEVTLNSTQDSVTNVDVIRTQLMETIFMDPITHKPLMVRDENGMITSLNLGPNVTVHRVGGSSAAMSDINVADPILVNFVGANVTDIAIPDSVRGKVSSVNSAANELVVTDPLKADHKVTISNGVRINLGQSTASSINALNAGDRVLVVKDQNGRVIVNVAKTENRVFWSYLTATNEIKLKVGTLSQTQTYKLHPRVYVHKGDENLSVSSLADGDSLTLYLVGDQVVEIEKR